jgi:hypothetical protein
VGYIFGIVPRLFFSAQRHRKYTTIWFLRKNIAEFSAGTLAVVFSKNPFIMKRYVDFQTFSANQPAP